MSNEPRKATDVLLELESKIDLILNMVRSQDLNIKILSNKLNNIISNQPTVTAEVVDTNPFTMVPEPTIQIPVSSENQLQIDNSPIGFRRTSRPETYSGNDKKVLSEPKFPVQMPKAEVIVPQAVINVNQSTVEQSKQTDSSTATHINSVPVKQRVIDKNGKSVFLADVEIINVNSGEKITKTRTNGTGKWIASLVPGTYKVVLSKRESVTKEKIELIQEINVDGKVTPLELPALIFK